MVKDLVKKTKKELGASMLEYALLAALIAVVCIAAITALGKQSSKSFSQITSGMTSAG